MRSQRPAKARTAAAVLIAGSLLAISGTSASAGMSASVVSPPPVAASSSPASSRPMSSRPAAQAAPIPLLAFYYSWFDVSSWRRAKNDYPLLGRYTSDDPAVMRQHIRWAKAAGINGFIVSWKDTPTNTRRLSLLMGVARSEDFKLAMIYQGLDFQRRPLPVERVEADFRYFEQTYASDSVFFRLGGKPLTVWSGTWAYSTADVARVVAPVRDSMLVLNTEKSLKGYQRLAAITDGDAYYWSSVNPATNKNYAPKLAELARAIHADGNYWMAPFAPGFDARKVGGTKIVERAAGATLRTEYATALSSSPDVLGLISWNEFSENSHVEPSERYGHLYLKVLADLRKAVPPAPDAAADSSDPGTADGGTGWLHHPSSQLIILLAAAAVFFGGLAVLRPIVRRRDQALGLLGVSSPVALPAREPHVDGYHEPLTTALTLGRWRDLTNPHGIALPPVDRPG